MRLVILGSGTAVPSATRASSGYWVEAGRAVVRLDAGAGTLMSMARAQLPWQSVTHQFLSHFHLDHAGELAAFLFALKWGREGARSTPLALLGPVGTRRLVEKLAELFEGGLLEQEFPITIEELASGQTVPLDEDVSLSVWKAPHNDESLAVRIDADGCALGYTGDTEASPELARFFNGVDVLVAECSFPDGRHSTRHLSIDETADLATAARARHLVATHSYFDPAAVKLADQLAARFSGKITVATDGAAIDCAAR
jgi:ribonuclease BN (tRNA processing enzyme)